MSNPLYEIALGAADDAHAMLKALPPSALRPPDTETTFQVSSGALASLLHSKESSPTVTEEIEALSTAVLLAHQEGEAHEEQSDDLSVFERWADAFLTDRYVSDAAYRRLAAAYNPTTDLPRLISGFLGFVALLDRVQHMADHPQYPELSSEETETAYRPLLEDAAVRDFMDRWYAFSRVSSDEIQVRSLRMHKVGTTSFVLHAWARGASGSATSTEVALKCLIPRYSEITPIKEATVAYRERMVKVRDAASTPDVKDFSSERFIAMDFIEGPTLSERAQTELKGYGREDLTALLASDKARSFITSVIGKVADALAGLARYDLRHEDLSPHNIIVADDGKVFLIDFGRNYLVDEILRAGASYEAIVMFVAPELIDDPNIDTYECDLYSLGIILLDLLTGGGLTRGRINERLMRLWAVAPGLAHLVQELLALDASRRRAATGANSSSSPSEMYERLKERIQEEVEIAASASKTVEAENWTDPRGMRMAIADYLKVKPPEIGALFGAAQALIAMKRASATERARYFSWLGWLTRAYIFSWAVVFVPAFGLTVADLVVTAGKEAPTDGFLGWVADNTHLVIGHPLHNIPGRAIGVTTALIAIAYYMNIFAAVDTRALRDADSIACRYAPFAARLFPLVAIVGQGLTVYYDPRLWGYTAGIGGLLVSANNWLWLKVVERAQERFGEQDRLADDMEEFKKSFGRWWWLMGLYSLGVLVGGLLVRAHVAHDEVVYAVVIAAGINIAKLYSVNTVRESPRVRARLARAASA